MLVSRVDSVSKVWSFSEVLPLGGVWLVRDLMLDMRNAKISFLEISLVEDSIGNGVSWRWARRTSVSTLPEK